MKAEFWKVTDGSGNSAIVFVCDGRVVTQTIMRVREEISTTVKNHACGQPWEQERALAESYGWTLELLPDLTAAIPPAAKAEPPR